MSAKPVPSSSPAMLSSKLLLPSTNVQLSRKRSAADMLSSKPPSTPVQKPVSTPVQKPVSTPVQKPVSTPVQKPIPKSAKTGTGTDDAKAGKSAERQRYETKIATLRDFVAGKQAEIDRLNVDIQQLEQKRQTVLKTRNDFAELHRINVGQQYLIGCRDLLQAGVDDDLLDLRLRQMLDFYSAIPASEKSEQSLIESWNSSFDVTAMTPKTIAKDHCEVCHRPLVLIKKQALLSCVGCARLTKHFMPLSHPSGWIKTGSSGGSGSQPENKRVKAIIARLLQFKSGGPAIPPSVILTVKEYLRSRHHGGGGPAQPTPVAEALEARDLHRYIAVAGKIANLLNGQEVCELSEDQINDIVSRLRATQAACAIMSVTFFGNYFTNRICELKGLPAVAAAFPPNRTNRILREQIAAWRRVHARLRLSDATHDW